MLTPQEITSLYLYGTKEVPVSLSESALIRKVPQDPTKSEAFSSTEVDVIDFMNPQTGPGRFAVGPQFDYVRRFFETSSTFLFSLSKQRGYSVSIDPNNIDASGKPVEIISLNKEEINSVLGLDDRYWFSLRHFGIRDSYDDYANRVFIFNSQVFSIGNEARFIIKSNGEKYIENFVIFPSIPNKDGTYQDNFDFVGGGNFTKIGNIALEPTIDPYCARSSNNITCLGRTVNINYVGREKMPRVTYTQEMYLADRRKVSSWENIGVSSATTLLIPRITKITNALYEAGITRFTTKGPKPKLIVYGTVEDDNLDRQRFKAMFDVVANNYGARRLKKDYAQNGLYIIGSEGDDNLEGVGTSDVLLGGSGVDVLQGNDLGDDYKGDTPEVDVLTGGPGADLFLVGQHNREPDEISTDQVGERLVGGIIAKDYALITDFEPGIDNLSGLPLNYQVIPMEKLPDGQYVGFFPGHGDPEKTYDAGILTDENNNDYPDEGEHVIVIIQGNYRLDDPVFRAR